MQNQAETKAKIRQFLSQYFNTAELADDADFFELGYVNSLFAMQLVMFVESEFAFEVENEDLELDNFRTIDAITNLIEKKTVNQTVSS